MDYWVIQFHKVIGSLSVCRTTSETAESIELVFGRNLLDLGVVLDKKFSGSVHRFAGNQGKTGFYSSISLY